MKNLYVDNNDIEVICQYCGFHAELVTGKVIYPHRKDLSHLNFWLCEQDNAYVGCHNGTEKPFGTLANKELRNLRKEAHLRFDTTWEFRTRTRSEAYKDLAKYLSINKKDCHIGMFSLENCYRVIAYSINYE